MSDSQIVRAWGKLTPMEQGVVSQRRREGKTFAQIAAESKRSLSTISTIWYRAAKKIAAA